MCETLLYAKGRGMQPRRHLESRKEGLGCTTRMRGREDDHIVLRRRGNMKMCISKIFGSIGERYRIQIERGGAI